MVRVLPACFQDAPQILSSAAVILGFHSFLQSFGNPSHDCSCFSFIQCSRPASRASRVCTHERIYFAPVFNSLLNSSHFFSWFIRLDAYLASQRHGIPRRSATLQCSLHLAEARSRGTLPSLHCDLLRVIQRWLHADAITRAQSQTVGRACAYFESTPISGERLEHYESPFELLQLVQCNALTFPTHSPCRFSMW